MDGSLTASKIHPHWQNNVILLFIFGSFTPCLMFINRFDLRGARWWGFFNRHLVDTIFPCFFMTENLAWTPRFSIGISHQFWADPDGLGHLGMDEVR